MGLDLRHLLAFRAVARRGGFGRAAREIGRSQPTVTLAIQTLERELGVRLLDRTARLTSTDPEVLTTRETEVLRHVALGLSNRDIAAALSVSEETVKTHVTHVLAKLNVDNRAQAIVQALKRGLVTLDELQ